jgi:CTP:molybdopterin cytidylyltransferase MocA
VRVAGVVLAAGAARRFGAPKQLAGFGGRPLLQYAVDVACEAPELDDVVVVLGAHAEDIRAALDFGRADVVVCRDWARGLSASLQCGVRAAQGADWVVVTLGDEPVLPVAAISAVVAAARNAAPAVTAVRATWNARPGHPVALHASVAERVSELRGDEGARSLLDRVVTLEVDCSPLGAPTDVDTPEDLAALPQPLRARAVGQRPCKLMTRGDVEL